MDTTKAMSLALILVASSSFVAAQDEKAKPVPASAATPLVISKVKVELEVPVTGLTLENAPKVESALEGLQAVLYDCSACAANFEKAGSCPACTSALQPEPHPILETVTVSPEQNKVMIATQSGMQVRLSDIERSLGTASVKIDDRRMALMGNSTLVVAGVANAEQAKAIQKALEDAKLFQKVSATAQGGLGMIEVTAGTTGSTRARVDAVLVKVASAHKLQDVIWNSWSVGRGV